MGELVLGCSLEHSLGFIPNRVDFSPSWSFVGLSDPAVPSSSWASPFSPSLQSLLSLAVLAARRAVLF